MAFLERSPLTEHSARCVAYVVSRRLTSQHLMRWFCCCHCFFIRAQETSLKKCYMAWLFFHATQKRQKWNLNSRQCLRPSPQLGLWCFSLSASFCFASLSLGSFLVQDGQTSISSMSHLHPAFKALRSLALSSLTTPVFRLPLLQLTRSVYLASPTQRRHAPASHSTFCSRSLVPASSCFLTRLTHIPSPLALPGPVKTYSLHEASPSTQASETPTSFLGWRTCSWAADLSVNHMLLCLPFWYYRLRYQLSMCYCFVSAIKIISSLSATQVLPLNFVIFLTSCGACTLKGFSRISVSFYMIIFIPG